MTHGQKNIKLCIMQVVKLTDLATRAIYFEPFRRKWASSQTFHKIC